MTTATLSWVTVKDAAVAAETTESRLRTAYRTGRIGCTEDLVGGRVRKLVYLPEVLAWAGVAPAVEEAVPASPAPIVAADNRFDDLADRADQALRRATRAEDQLALVRNELAQLRESYQRVNEVLARREAAEFEASVRTMCSTAAARPARRHIFGFTRRRASA